MKLNRWILKRASICFEKWKDSWFDYGNKIDLPSLWDQKEDPVKIQLRYLNATEDSDLTKWWSSVKTSFIFSTTKVVPLFRTKKCSNSNWWCWNDPVGRWIFWEIHRAAVGWFQPRKLRFNRVDDDKQQNADLLFSVDVDIFVQYFHVCDSFKRRLFQMAIRWLDASFRRSF